MNAKNAVPEPAGSTSKRDWSVEQLSGNSRYKLEKLSGGSFMRVLDCIDVLDLGGAIGQDVTRDGNTYRLDYDDKSDESLIKIGREGEIPSYSLKIEPGQSDIFTKTTIQLSRIDPDNPDYKYPERVASATILQHRESVEISGHGFLSPRNVPDFVKAMEFFRPILASVTKPDPARKINDIYLEDADVMRIADGGLCGNGTLEYARKVQTRAAETMLMWAAVAMPEVSDAMERRDLVWGKSYLNYNDLDNNAFTIPMPDDGEGNSRFALFHQNISLISEFSSFIAVGTCSEHGILSNIELIGLDRSKDDIFEICAAVNAGDFEGQGLRIASFDHATGHLGIPGQIDETGVLEDFCFYLGCDHEMVAEGQMDIGRHREDSRIETNFESFRREYEEEYEFEP